MKYYFSCGTLELIWSTNKSPEEAVRTYIHEVTEEDELDEYIYIDERGFRGYVSADNTTLVVETEQVLRDEGYIH
jgi:hypothetical protein